LRAARYIRSPRGNSALASRIRRIARQHADLTILPSTLGTEMRSITLTFCLVALAACADSKNPTSPPRLSVDQARPSEPSAPHERIDPRNIADRIESLVRSRFARVALPADGYSLSSEAVHPDIACPPASPWNGTRCWLLYTPYKNSDASYENPAFLAVGSDTEWTTPAEVVNPVIRYPGTGQYNSDPDHAFDPATGRLIQMYRLVADTMNRIMLMSTANARQWTTPVVAFKERNHDAVSPALLIDSDRSAKVWYVRTGAEGCQSNSSNVVFRTTHPGDGVRFEQAEWSPPTVALLSIPGAVIWHLDVIDVPQGYLALIAAFPKGASCSSSDLWLATSTDGIRWKAFAVPLLWRGMSMVENRSLTTWYRGTMRYDAETDMLHLWPSALAGARWGVYHVSARLTELLAVLGSAQASDWRALALKQPRARLMPDMP
jgi:hypothetical protein